MNVFIFGQFFIFPQQTNAEMRTYTEHCPISINGNSDFDDQASQNNWRGSGVPGDPYIIENYEIHVSPPYWGIKIINTTRHFIIKNNHIYADYAVTYGIYINDSHDASVESNIINTTHDTVLIEIKAVKSLQKHHIAQCLNYLKATGLKICLLINFGGPSVEIKRVVYKL